MAEVNSIVLTKTPTGIIGFDKITNGGLPQGRTTLVCGGPGCGKTLFSTEFLVHGALEYNEPGVFMAFEETANELKQNVASLGFDLQTLVEQKKIFVDYIYIERSEIEETGIYDLEGLFIRLASAIDEVGAKRVVLDTLETLFTGFQNETVLRAELRRLFRWLKERGVTAIVTGERGNSNLTRYGIEEYVSDCVLLLENRVVNKIATRILRVVKYRGSGHGGDEYPFLIGNNGIWVQPITSLHLDYPVSNEFISTGVPGLDEMLHGKGYYRGSSVLISGSAGTGKTSLAASLVDAACRRGERCLYFAFEESESQIIRNLRSIGIDLEHWVKKGLLKFQAARPSFFSIEMHLLTIQKLLEEFRPSVAVIDPLTNLISIASSVEVKAMLVRLIDFLKLNQITSIFNSLTTNGDDEVNTEVGISSLMDAWILVRNLETNGERNRALYVLKARGIAHSTQIREFRLTNEGIALVNVFIGPEGVLTGSAREVEESRVRYATMQRQAEIERKRRDMERKRRSVEAQIEELKSSLEAEETQLNLILSQEHQLNQFQGEERGRMESTRSGKFNDSQR